MVFFFAKGRGGGDFFFPPRYFWGFGTPLFHFFFFFSPFFFPPPFNLPSPPFLFVCLKEKRIWRSQKGKVKLRGVFFLLGGGGPKKKKKTQFFPAQNFFQPGSTPPVFFFSIPFKTFLIKASIPKILLSPPGGKKKTGKNPWGLGGFQFQKGRKKNNPALVL